MITPERLTEIEQWCKKVRKVGFTNFADTEDLVKEVPAGFKPDEASSSLVCTCLMTQHTHQNKRMTMKPKLKK